jgi:hypothetical protein
MILFDKSKTSKYKVIQLSHHLPRISGTGILENLHCFGNIVARDKDLKNSSLKDRLKVQYPLSILEI